LGDAIPQKYPFFFFFRGFAAQKEEKTGLGLHPQSHEPVQLTPMLTLPPERLRVAASQQHNTTQPESGSVPQAHGYGVQL
jgi:hypothetical protein